MLAPELHTLPKMSEMLTEKFTFVSSTEANCTAQSAEHKHFLPFILKHTVVG